MWYNFLAVYLAFSSGVLSGIYSDILSGAARTAQLLTECKQYPPRSAAQRARQTAQDPKKSNLSASKEIFK